MKQLNEILKELGISKVKLAKYLGVSRQMVYNYLELDDINKWPKDKKMKLFTLLGIKSNDELSKIVVDTDYILRVDSILSELTDDCCSSSSSNSYSVNGVSFNSDKEEKVFNTLVELISDRLSEDATDGYNICKYLCNLLQSIDNSPEIKYLLAYIAKSAGFVKPLEFVFNKEEQFNFESIIFSAFTLYNNGGAAPSRLADSHKRFVAEIEHRNEEIMSRTQILNTAKIQALRELGYSSITEENAVEVFEKIAEIQSRKVI